MKIDHQGKRKLSRLGSLMILGTLACCLCSATQAQNAPTPPPPAWHGDMAFGLSLSRGNSDTLLMNASASAHREWKHDELKLGVDGAYGVNDWGQDNETPSA